MDINEVVKLALRAIKADPKAVDAGEYRLDGTRVIIDLSGKLVKGEAEYHPPTTSIPLIPAIALAVQMMGIQRERFMEVLEVAMNAAIASNEKGNEYIAAFNKDWAATANRVKEAPRNLPPRRHEGKVYPRDVAVDVVIEPGPALVASATVPAP